MRILVILLFLAASVLAESFGGIGVTIQASSKGVQVVTVIPGSPASLQGLSAGDEILTVNNVPLEGKSLEQATALLRGVAGEPIQVSLTRAKDGELWVGNITRANLDVQLIQPKDIASWSENSSNLSQEDVAQFASVKTQTGFLLLGILQYGRIVAQGEKLAPQQISSVYMGTAETPRPPQLEPIGAKISLLSFTRQRVSLALTLPGELTVSIYDIQGKEVQLWNLPKAQAGEHNLVWKNNQAPSQGSYVMVARQGSAKTSWEVQLR